MNKLILRVDASALKESACMLRFYRIVVEGWKESLNSNDVEYGSAVHAFIAHMERTDGDYASSIQAAKKRFDVPMNIKPKKQYLNQTHLLKTCLDFEEKVMRRDDFITLRTSENKPMAELKFELPFYEDDSLAVLVCGTIDRLCKHKRGTYAVDDYKTTSMWDVKEYFRGYLMSPQLLMYRWAVRRHAQLFPDSIWREVDERDCACFIDGIFLKGADKDTEFHRSDVFQFTEKQLSDFEFLMNVKIKELVNYAHAVIAPMKEGLVNGACQTIYGHCKFFNVCAAFDDIHAEHVLKRNFIQKPYNPMEIH